MEKVAIRLFSLFLSLPALTAAQYVTCDPQNPSNRCLAQSAEQQLSNHRYYSNSSGNVVHAPARALAAPPVNASAQCWDGSYSFSERARGTCSRHGGVAQWLR